MPEQPDLQPDDLEALQAEPGPEPAVNVHIAGATGPVRIQELPRKSGATKTLTGVGVLPGGLTRILAADHRRAIARVISVGQPMLFALTNAAAQDSSRMALWPAGVVLELTADTELWVASSTATTSISVMTEFWATGE